MTDLLWKFCHHGDEEARVEARLAIIERGDAIIPELIQAVDEELQRVKQVHLEIGDDGVSPAYSNPEPLRRLVKLLAIYEHASSLLSLTEVAIWKPEVEFQKPFLYVRTFLERRAAPADINALIETLSKLRGVPKAKPKVLLIATALLRMAESDPKPELRAALPLLKLSLRTPWEFVELRRRLITALGEESLPIPASPPQDAEALPIPAMKEDRNDK